MELLTSISFFEVAMALLFVGLAERVLLAYAPAAMVGFCAVISKNNRHHRPLLFRTTPPT